MQLPSLPPSVCLKWGKLHTWPLLPIEKQELFRTTTVFNIRLRPVVIQLMNSGDVPHFNCSNRMCLPGGFFPHVPTTSPASTGTPIGAFFQNARRWADQKGSDFGNIIPTPLHKVTPSEWVRSCCKDEMYFSENTTVSVRYLISDTGFHGEWSIWCSFFSSSHVVFYLLRGIRVWIR